MEAVFDAHADADLPETNIAGFRLHVIWKKILPHVFGRMTTKNPLFMRV